MVRSVKISKERLKGSAASMDGRILGSDAVASSGRAPGAPGERGGKRKERHQEENRKKKGGKRSSLWDRPFRALTRVRGPST